MKDLEAQRLNGLEQMKHSVLARSRSSLGAGVDLEVRQEGGHVRPGRPGDPEESCSITATVRRSQLKGRLDPTAKPTPRVCRVESVHIPHENLRWG